MTSTPTPYLIPTEPAGGYAVEPCLWWQEEDLFAAATE
jgi:hypothetical protein